MFTRLGKWLVYFQIILSIMFAGVAVGIFTNRIDWAAKGDAAQAKQAVEQKRRDSEQVQGLGLAARTRWKAATDDLAKLEDKIPKDKAWYASQLDKLAKGGPVQTLKYQEGVLQRDPATGLPVLENSARQLLPADQARQQLNQIDNQINVETKAVSDLAVREDELTKQIKGLRGGLETEQKTEQKILAELERLIPMRYNYQAEFALLHKRQTSLLARIKELESANLTSRQP